MIKVLTDIKTLSLLNKTVAHSMIARYRTHRLGNNVLLFQNVTGNHSFCQFVGVYIRDWPFNLKWGLWIFVSFRIFFPDNTRVRIFLFCRAKREFFFQNLTLGYMTKTLNQIIFFFSTKIRIFFSATLGIRIFF